MAYKSGRWPTRESAMKARLMHESDMFQSDFPSLVLHFTFHNQSGCIQWIKKASSCLIAVVTSENSCSYLQSKSRAFSGAFLHNETDKVQNISTQQPSCVNAVDFLQKTSNDQLPPWSRHNLDKSWGLQMIYVHYSPNKVEILDATNCYLNELLEAC